jgi:isorenieratene synthase
MERAAVTGFLAANTLLAPLGVASEPIRSVPTRGLFAPVKLWPGRAARLAQRAAEAARRAEVRV